MDAMAAARAAAIAPSGGPPVTSGNRMTHVVTSLVLMLTVAVAVREDLLEHRIPNWLTFGVLAVGIATQGFFGGLGGLLGALAGAGVGLACFLPLYLGRGMGAGDVKLMGAVGAFLGPANGLLAAALAMVFGAVLAVALVAWRLIEFKRAVPEPAGGCGFAATSAPSAVSALRKERFPYAVAIALGVIATLWIRGTFAAALRSLGVA